MFSHRRAPLGRVLIHNLLTFPKSAPGISVISVSSCSVPAKQSPSLPSAPFHSSNLSFFHYSIIPILHPSITPSFHHSVLGPKPASNPPGMKAGQVPHPHLRNSLEDALALARKHQDPFYLEAVLIEAWLALLVLQSICEYASKKDPKDRSLQTG